MLLTVIFSIIKVLVATVLLGNAAYVAFSGSVDSFLTAERAAVIFGGLAFFVFTMLFFVIDRHRP